MAAILKLLEQVAKPAADHAARGAACEQAAEAALEQVAESAASGQTGIHGVRRWDRRGGAAARLIAAEMLGRLVGKQREDCHGHRRHAAFGIGIAGRPGTARAVLHAVQYVEQTHGSLLSRAGPAPTITLGHDGYKATR